ncbi:tetratricopeptide repeat protein [Aegicerativicinus sediminis]
MKKVLLVSLMLIGTIGMMAQDNAQLKKHFEQYYKMMREHGDVQGMINAMTHLEVVSPSQARRDTLAYIYTTEGRYVQALNTIGIDIKPTDTDMNIEVKAIALKAVNQPQRALEQYQELFKRKPAPAIAYELADLKMQTNNVVGAKKDIEYGLANVTADMKRAYFESQQPYEVPLKAGFLYLKGIALFNEDQVGNLDTAIGFMDQALTEAPNFNMARITKDALNAKKNPPKAQPKTNN